MQTELADFIRETDEGQTAERILRACVHCGFCTATCPTYQLLGDELDGPRGRIYQIKEVLEGAPATERTREHLDRCLLCRSCETTCPSGVEFGRLLEIGRDVVEEQVPRTGMDALMRKGLLQLLPNRKGFALALKAGRLFRPMVPASLRHKIPAAPDHANTQDADWPEPRHERRMLILTGCVQPVLAPRIDLALARILDRLGVSLIRVDTGCCGALPQHLSEIERARAMARHNINAWWPHIDRADGSAAEAVLVTASGCGVTVRQYDELLAQDADYSERAQRVASLTRDPVEVLSDMDLSPLGTPGGKFGRLAFHTPCTLQHGLGLNGRVEAVLRQLGFDLAPVADGHLCCGSAGTYSILQSELSTSLKHRKIEALTIDEPELIATANIGCLDHLANGSPVRVKHWLELVEPA